MQHNDGMQITRWSEYGILISLLLGRETLHPQKEKSEPVGAEEIAYQLDISSEYVQQICQKLKKADIIKGVKGPGGGFVLFKSPSIVTVKDIIEACEGATFDLICDEEVINCERIVAKGFCPVHTIWKGLKVVMDDYLSEQTIETMVKQWLAKPEETTPELVQISSPESAA